MPTHSKQIRPASLPANKLLTLPGQEPRPSAADRGYDHAWRKRRDKWLVDHPKCVFHARRGKDVMATVVDHIKPKELGGADDESNWQSLCEHCHNSEKQRVDAEARRRINEGGGQPMMRPANRNPTPAAIAADETRQRKANIVGHINLLCDTKSISPADAAHLIGIDEQRAIDIMRGDVDDVSVPMLNKWYITLKSRVGLGKVQPLV